MSRRFTRASLLVTMFLLTFAAIVPHASACAIGTCTTEGATEVGGPLPSCCQIDTNPRHLFQLHWRARCTNGCWVLIKGGGFCQVNEVCTPP